MSFHKIDIPSYLYNFARILLGIDLFANNIKL